MKILSLEIMGNSAGMLIIDGDKKAYSVTNFGKALEIPKDDNSVGNVIKFQSEFSSQLQKLNPDRVVVCEGGKDSKKLRVRMEFAVLTECEKQNLDYKTYPTGSCTRLINSNYEKETGREFSEDLNKHNLPKYMGKTLVAGWRFLD